MRKMYSIQRSLNSWIETSILKKTHNGSLVNCVILISYYCVPFQHSKRINRSNPKTTTCATRLFNLNTNMGMYWFFIVFILDLKSGFGYLTLYIIERYVHTSTMSIFLIYQVIVHVKYRKLIWTVLWIHSLSTWCMVNGKMVSFL